MLPSDYVIPLVVLLLTALSLSLQVTRFRRRRAQSVSSPPAPGWRDLTLRAIEVLHHFLTPLLVIGTVGVLGGSYSSQQFPAEFLALAGYYSGAVLSVLFLATILPLGVKRGWRSWTLYTPALVLLFGAMRIFEPDRLAGSEEGPWFTFPCLYFVILTGWLFRLIQYVIAAAPAPESAGEETGASETSSETTPVSGSPWLLLVTCTLLGGAMGAAAAALVFQALWFLMYLLVFALPLAVWFSARRGLSLGRALAQHRATARLRSETAGGLPHF